MNKIVINILKSIKNMYFYLKKRPKIQKKSISGCYFFLHKIFNKNKSD